MPRFPVHRQLLELNVCMYCEMIATVKLINTSITHVITPLFLPPSLPSFLFFFFFFVVRTLIGLSS